MIADARTSPFAARTRPGDPAVIFVEGFPGLGKTSQAQRVFLHLLAEGYTARWIEELDVPHPITDDLMLGELEVHGWQAAPFMERTLERWRSLGRALQHRREIVVMDATLLQVCVGKLHQLDVDERTILAYLDEALRGLDGVATELIYLGDHRALRTAWSAQSRQFRAAHLQQLPRFPYLQRRGLRGTRGLFAYAEALEALYLQAMAHPRLPTLRVAVARGAAATTAQIVNGLGLTRPLPQLAPEALAPFTGAYRADHRAPDVIVRCHPHGLALHMRDQRIPLLPCPRAPDTFHGARLNLALHFARDAGARIASVTCASPGDQRWDGVQWHRDATPERQTPRPR